MGIKEIRMKYRQKAMPDRSGQYRSCMHVIVETVTNYNSLLRQYGPLGYDAGLLNNLQHEMINYERGYLENADTLARFLELAEQYRYEAPMVQGMPTMLQMLDRQIERARSLLQIQEAQHWNDATVVRIAQNIIQTQDWDSAPILADALEEAGCTDERLLRYLRDSNPNSNLVVHAVRQIAGL